MPLAYVFSEGKKVRTVKTNKYSSGFMLTGRKSLANCIFVSDPSQTKCPHDIVR